MDVENRAPWMGLKLAPGAQRLLWVRRVLLADTQFKAGLDI